VLLFWLLQSVDVIFLPETIDHIEHDGLQRRSAAVRTEAFAVSHAWNADHRLKNATIAKLQRYSDHHMHA